jgi:endoribonuclease Dicer
MVEHSWDKEFWDMQFDNYMVIVCTAAILQKCLAHAFIKMEQVNLLIFDEAHHAKKSHPYARIIKDYYVKMGGERPRILGMTSSPADSNGDVETAASQLESILHSRIASIDSLLLSKEFRQQQTELVELYDPLPIAYETELHKDIRNQAGNSPYFKRYLAFSKEATSQLGPWCADRFWKLCFTEEETSKLVFRTEQVYDSWMPQQSDSQNREISLVRAIRKLVDTHELDDINEDLTRLSSKTMHLISILQDHFAYSTNHKCIVFVKMRYTVVVLVDLLQKIHSRVPFLKPASFVGII